MIPPFLRPFAHRLRSLYLPVYASIFFHPEAEPLSLLYYPQYVSKNDFVVEVGSFQGGGTLLLSRLAGLVWAFEPNPYSFAIIKGVLARERLRNVVAVCEAISERDGTANLKATGTTSSSMGDSIPGAEGVAYRSALRVKTRALDSVQFPRPPDVLVMDCEGSEVGALRGGTRVVARLRAAIVETHVLADGRDTTDEVMEILASRFGKAEVTRPAKSWSLVLAGEKAAR